MAKSKKKGLGRGLEAYEVALIKNMRQRKMPRDYIMSFIIRPGRVTSPAAVDDVAKGRIGGDIEAATDDETDLFISKRLGEARPISERDLGGPVTSSRVHEILRTANRLQKDFLALEDRFVEFKEDASSKISKHAIAKTMAAFSNTVGGYVFFGIGDDGSVPGLSLPATFPKFADAVSDIATEFFCPRIVWDKNVVRYKGKEIGVIYAYQSTQRPVIAMKDGTGIDKAAIYLRYEGKSQRIEPGDLIALLSELRVQSPPSQPNER